MTQIRIPVEKLPTPDKNGDHAFQFRIISVDKNQLSTWSQLYLIKSIGQYRPLESNITAIISSEEVSVTWDTPIYYNYDGVSDAIVTDPVSGSIVSINSASVITHNHSQNFKQHSTDIFVQWDNENFQYHDRVISDHTSILIPTESASVRVIGIVALKDIPRQNTFELDETFNERVEQYLGVSASVQGVYDLFKIFDTGVISLLE
jgi:hypothetical protein